MNTTLREALLAAGKIQKDNFSKVHQISIKESISSIVTEVDVASEKSIMDMMLVIDGKLGGCINLITRYGMWQHLSC